MALLLFLSTVTLICGYTDANVTESRTVAGFKGIDVSGPFVVLVDIGDSASLRIEAAIDDSNVTDSISTTVENEILKIKFLWPYDVDVGAFSGLIHIYVTAETVATFVLSGSGALIVNSELVEPSISAVMSGSGNITLAVSTKTVNLVLSGSGFLDITGTTDSVNMVVSGAGKILGDHLQAALGTIAIYGAGDVNIDARDSLQVVLMGSGTVKYLGNPKLNVMKMGSGSVIKV